MKSKYFLIPSKKQWERWTLPTQLAVVVAYIVIVGTIFKLCLLVYDLGTKHLNQTIISNDVFVNDEDFKVLILPFNQYGSVGSYDCGQIITQRLNDLNFKDKLQIDAHFLDIELSANFKDDSIVQLVNDYDANLVIYGDYFIGKGDNPKSDIFIVKYLYGGSSYDIPPYFPDRRTREFPNVSLIDLKKGIGQNDLDFIIYWISGMSYYSKGDLESAKKKFQYIDSKLSTIAFDVHWKLAEIYSHEKKYDLVIKHCDKIIQIFKSLSEVNEKIKDEIGGIAYREAKLMCNGNLHAAYGVKAAVFEIQEDYQKALVNYNTSISYDTLSEITYLHRGEVKTNLGMNVSASLDLSRQINTKPKYDELLFDRAKLKQRMGDEKGALLDYLRQIKYYPEFMSLQ